MNPDQYLVESERTEARFSSVPMSESMLLVLKQQHAASQFLQQLKRVLIYGQRPDEYVTQLVEDPNQRLIRGEQFEMLHMSLGMVTEANEFFELVIQMIERDASAESIRLEALNELGDYQWYVAGAMRKTGLTMEEVLSANIGKLRKRFPDKFDAELALTKNSGAA